jgi:hypothetical protein
VSKLSSPSSVEFLGGVFAGVLQQGLGVGVAAGDPGGVAAKAVLVERRRARPRWRRMRDMKLPVVGCPWVGDTGILNGNV